MALIDESSLQIVARVPTEDYPDGIAYANKAKKLYVSDLAFVACEENAKLAVFDLETKKMTELHSIGADPDVLAFDKSLSRLYVSAESGIISVFDERSRTLQKVGERFFAPNAHSVAVDSRTHRIYFPLQSVGGKPVLRIALPSDKQL